MSSGPSSDGENDTYITDSGTIVRKSDGKPVYLDYTIGLSRRELEQLEQNKDVHTHTQQSTQPQQPITTYAQVVAQGNTSQQKQTIKQASSIENLTNLFKKSSLEHHLPHSDTESIMERIKKTKQIQKKLTVRTKKGDVTDIIARIPQYPSARKKIKAQLKQAANKNVTINTNMTNTSDTTAPTMIKTITTTAPIFTQPIITPAISTAPIIPNFTNMTPQTTYQSFLHYQPQPIYTQTPQFTHQIPQSYMFSPTMISQQQQQFQNTQENQIKTVLQLQKELKELQEKYKLETEKFKQGASFNQYRSAMPYNTTTSEDQSPSDSESSYTKAIPKYKPSPAKTKLKPSKIDHLIKHEIPHLQPKLELGNSNENNLNNKKAQIDGERSMIDTTSCILNVLKKLRPNDKEIAKIIDAANENIEKQRTINLQSQKEIDHTTTIARYYQPWLEMPDIYDFTDMDCYDTKIILEHRNIRAGIEPFNPDKNENQDFSNFWDRVLAYTKGHKLCENSYIRILNTLIQGDASRTFTEMVKMEHPLQDILKALNELYSTRRTILTDIDDLNKFVREPGENISKAMRRATILVERTAKMYDPVIWKVSKRHEILTSIIKQIVTNNTRKHLESTEIKYWKIGTTLSYDAIIDLVETYESTYNEIPNNDMELTINVCSGSLIHTKQKTNNKNNDKPKKHKKDDKFTDFMKTLEKIPSNNKKITGAINVVRNAVNIMLGKTIPQNTPIQENNNENKFKVLNINNKNNHDQQNNRQKVQQNNNQNQQNRKNNRYNQNNKQNDTHRTNQHQTNRNVNNNQQNFKQHNQQNYQHNNRQQHKHFRQNRNHQNNRYNNNNIQNTQQHRNRNDNRNHDYRDKQNFPRHGNHIPSDRDYFDNFYNNNENKQIFRKQYQHNFRGNHYNNYRGNSNRGSPYTRGGYQRNYYDRQYHDFKQEQQQTQQNTPQQKNAQEEQKERIRLRKERDYWNAVKRPTIMCDTCRFDHEVGTYCPETGAYTKLDGKDHKFSVCPLYYTRQPDIPDTIPEDMDDGREEIEFIAEVFPGIPMTNGNERKRQTDQLTNRIDNNAQPKRKKLNLTKSVSVPNYRPVLPFALLTIGLPHNAGPNMDTLGANLNVLLDTGCSKSTIDYKVYEYLMKLYNNNTHNMTKSNAKIMACNKQEQTIKGMVKLRIWLTADLYQDTTAMVLDNLSEDFILGYDFLSSPAVRQITKNHIIITNMRGGDHIYVPLQKEYSEDLPCYKIKNSSSKVIKQNRLKISTTKTKHDTKNSQQNMTSNTTQNKENDEKSQLKAKKRKLKKLKIKKLKEKENSSNKEYLDTMKYEKHKYQNETNSTKGKHTNNESDHHMSHNATYEETSEEIESEEEFKNNKRQKTSQNTPQKRIDKTENDKSFQYIFERETESEIYDSVETENDIIHTPNYNQITTSPTNEYDTDSDTQYRFVKADQSTANCATRRKKYTKKKHNNINLKDTNDETTIENTTTTQNIQNETGFGTMNIDHEELRDDFNQYLENLTDTSIEILHDDNENDNENQRLFNYTDVQVISNTISDGIITTKQFIAAQNSDPFCTEIKDNKDMLGRKYILKEGILLRRTKYRMKPVLPRSLFDAVIFTRHFSMFGAHNSTSRILRDTEHLYYIPSKEFKEKLKETTSNCYICQVYNNNIEKELIKQLPKPNEPRISWSIDLITDTPNTEKGNNQILLCVDDFSSYVVCIPMQTVTAESVITALQSFIFAQFGIPKIIRSDEQSVFYSSKLFYETFKQLGIELQPTAVAAPISNARAESQIKNIKHLMRKFLYQENVTDIWDKYIHILTSSHNKSVGIYGYSAEQIMFGNRTPSKIDILDITCENVTEKDYIDLVMPIFEQQREIALKRMNLKAKQNRTFKNKNNVLKEFKIGSMVLHKQMQESTGTSSKYKPIYTGPYIVLKINKDRCTSILEHLKTGKLIKAHFTNMQLLHYTPTNHKLSDNFDSEIIKFIDKNYSLEKYKDSKTKFRTVYESSSSEDEETEFIPSNSPEY